MSLLQGILSAASTAAFWPVSVLYERSRRRVLCFLEPPWPISARQLEAPADRVPLSLEDDDAEGIWSESRRVFTRCQRSANCAAAGAPLAMAQPKLPARSRLTTSTLAQKNLRAWSRIVTGKPSQGRSAMVRQYRRCTLEEWWLQPRHREEAWYAWSSMWIVPAFW